MQGNSYLGLWGHVFDGSSSEKTEAATGPAPPPLLVKGGLADRLQHAAGEWRAEADEVRSRLIQRIGGGGTTVLEKLGDREAASSFMSETFNQLFGSADDKDSSGAADYSDTAAAISSTDTLSLLDRMQERLGIDGKLDARQLAALAAVQGLALSSLRKHLAANSATSDTGSVKSASADDNDASTNSIYDHRHTFSNLGIALPESLVSHFEGEWCVRLQNFANAAGYRSVYLGGAPCSSSGTTGAMTKSLPQTQPLLSTTPSTTTPAAAMIHWNSEAAFSLDCSIESPVSDTSEEDVEDSAAAEEEEESFYSGVSAMLHAARTKASSELTAALQAKTMGCSLAVSVNGGEISPQSSHSQSSGGSGTVLHSSQTLPVFNSHRLNAIKIRICNLPVHSLGSTPTGTDATTTLSSSVSGATTSAASINLHGLKVNNRHLAIDSLQGYPSNDCHVALVRLPTRALADGFVLNGYMTLEKGNTVGNTALYNVGEMASVEMQIGSLRLLSSSVDGASD
ncbi:hypothetical protein NADE_002899 [Nannochloris sp. 'desiccata']|nr:hypothetical protein KSW81_001037 [Chlorella desiccata (nom. nud.)]KAH7620272.1 hypothetical protein NADE_002899 [Chlorella desiccata (nom. nud.)]